MKFLLKATGLNNIAVRTALLILQDERISLGNSVSVDQGRPRHGGKEAIASNLG